MSHYTTRASSVDRDYIVIKHGIPNVNSILLGVKFRDGWAVVERDSKIYYRIKKLPMMRNCIEQPLDFLQKLPFITRSIDVKLIYGADVYAKYMTYTQKKEEVQQEIEEQVQEQSHLENPELCKYRLDKGDLCKHKVSDPSVSDHCPIHILKDPLLQEIGFKIPLAMDKKTRRKIKKTAFNKLKEYNSKKRKNNVSVDKEEITSEETKQSKQA